MLFTLIFLALVTIYAPGVDLPPATRERIERIAGQILSVTDSPQWEISVTVERPYLGGAGMSDGISSITISPSIVDSELALRHVIAHEMGHIMAGHRFTSSRQQQAYELEADRLGLEYWRRLGWPCKPWVNVRKRQADRAGSDDRTALYEQAKRICDKYERA